MGTVGDRLHSLFLNNVDKKFFCRFDDNFYPNICIDYSGYEDFKWFFIVSLLITNRNLLRKYTVKKIKTKI